MSNRATASSWIPGPSASLNSHGHCGQMERTELFIKMQILCFGSKWVLVGKWIQWQQILAEDLGTVDFLWGILVPWWGATIPQKSKKRTACWCVPVSPEMREAGSGYHSILVKRQKPIHQCPTQDRTKGLMGGEKTLQGAPDSCITALFPASPQRQCMQLMGSLSGEITLASSLHLTK